MYRWYAGDLQKLAVPSQWNPVERILVPGNPSAWAPTRLYFVDEHHLAFIQGQTLHLIDIP